MSKQISIYNPLDGINAADYSQLVKRDALAINDAMTVAHRMVADARTLRSILVEQGGRGRAWKCAEVLNAEYVAGAYIYALQCVLDEFESRGVSL